MCLIFCSHLLENQLRYIYMDINIFFARFHAALATVGRAGRGFGTTDLLTSLREELTFLTSQIWDGDLVYPLNYSFNCETAHKPQTPANCTAMTDF